MPETDPPSVLRCGLRKRQRIRPVRNDYETMARRLAFELGSRRGNSVLQIDRDCEFESIERELYDDRVM